MASILSEAFYPILAETSGNEPNIITYFVQSNFAGQVIVIVLILCSLAAWTVMIGKYLDLSRLRSLNLAFERKLSEASSILGIEFRGQVAALGPYAVSVANAVRAYRQHMQIENGKTISLNLRMGHVENALQRTVAEQTMRYESKMVFLGSIVSGAPFLGLLGTVWGVMDSFGSLSQQASATLQNLAPGVSGALLTTVAALLVAIPSVFGYNYLLTQTKLLISELENFASTIADRIELEMAEMEEGETADD